ncbi:MAG: hypothetical protein Q9173_002422 [Seirophora scorigena]
MSVYHQNFVETLLNSTPHPGKSTQDIARNERRTKLQYVHVGSVMHGVCIWFIKFSILLQYLQIFVPIKKASALYLTCHALIWTNFVFYVVSTFVEIFACSPVRKAWDPLITQGRCINILAVNVAASALNSVSDIAILIVPQVGIWRLQMSRQKKMQISAIFLIGIFACVASIVRLGYAIKLYIHHDITYYSWLTGLWTHPEMASGILVACLPVSLKFFQKLQQTRFFSQIGLSLQSLLGFTSNGSKRSTKGHSASQQISPRRASWPKNYEMLSDGQRFNGGKSMGDKGESVDESFQGHRSQQARPHIIRTVGVDARSESRRESDSDCENGPQGVWQGSSSYINDEYTLTFARVMAGKISVDGVALITGAAAGIGKETGFAFAEAGARVLQAPGVPCIAVKVDIVDEESVDAMVRSAMDEFGKIDYSVNSAGMGNVSGAMTPNVKVDVFSKTIETNGRGTMLCVRAVSKAMAGQEPLTHQGRRGSRDLGRGSIVNLGSVNSYCAAPGMMPYTASKHAVVGITKTAAIDNGKNGIRVNAVCPSWVDTPMMQASLERIPPLGGIIKAASPLGRAAEPEEVADYIVFLCSPSASYINGTGLIVDAGLTLTMHY